MNFVSAICRHIIHIYVYVRVEVSKSDSKVIIHVYNNNITVQKSCFLMLHVIQIIQN